MEKNPTQRFSDRVNNYVKFRPDYPAEMLSFLNKEIGLKGKVVYDIILLVAEVKYERNT